MSNPIESILQEFFDPHPAQKVLADLNWAKKRLQTLQEYMELVDATLEANPEATVDVTITFNVRRIYAMPAKAVKRELRREYNQVYGRYKRLEDAVKRMTEIANEV